MCIRDRHTGGCSNNNGSQRSNGKRLAHSAIVAGLTLTAVRLVNTAVMKSILWSSIIGMETTLIANTTAAMIAPTSVNTIKKVRPCLLYTSRCV